MLNCRLNGLNTIKPDLFIIDLKLNLKKNLSINNLTNKRKTFLITNKKNKNKVALFKKKGFKIIYLKSLNSKDDFKLMLQYIYKLGYSRAFFETGLTFLNSLINYKLVNELYVFKNEKILKKKGSNNSTSKYLKFLKLEKKIKINLNDDILYHKEF